MGKLGYIASQLRGLNWREMFGKAKEIKVRSGRPTLWTLADMVWCGYRYTAGFSDYYIFHFEKLSAAERATYLVRGRNAEYVRRMNPKASWDKFEIKTDFNRTFSDYLKRDWVDLQTDSFEAFDALVKKHPMVVAKLVDEMGGKGLECLRLADFESSRTMYDHCMDNKQYLVEEFVSQHPGIAALHPQSLNTLRMVTFQRNGRSVLVYSVIRIGRGESTVDNTSSGGMSVLVDIDTGRLLTPGVDKKDHVYTEHPDTGITLQGYQLPCFEAAKAMVLEAAKVVPEMGYIGWDVSVNDRGEPLLIEGNAYAGHILSQLPWPDRLGQGMLPRYQECDRLLDA